MLNLPRRVGIYDRQDALESQREKRDRNFQGCTDVVVEINHVADSVRKTT